MMASAAGQEHVHGTAMPADWILAAPFAFAAIAYIAAAASQRGRGHAWPWSRVLFWVIGVTSAAAGFIGPLASAAHDSFTAHMATHLLTGMVAPLFLVLAAPMTLALRAMSTVPARRLSTLLRSGFAWALTNPVVAALLSVGGMWVLYLTPLHELMREDMFFHLLVLMHLLFAGYLFTVSLVPVDPSPHRAGFVLRSVVLVLSLAAHSALAKLLYAHPPAGIATDDARGGAQLMFYGGDVVDLVLITLLCMEWYRRTGRGLRRRDASAIAAPGSGKDGTKGARHERSAP